MKVKRMEGCLQGAGCFSEGFPAANNWFSTFVPSFRQITLSYAVTNLLAAQKSYFNHLQNSCPKRKIRPAASPGESARHWRTEIDEVCREARNKPDVLNDRVLVVINKWKKERVVGRTENYI